MASWSFIIQRATTGEFLEWDLPLDYDSLTWDLSGGGSLSGSVPADVAALTTETGVPILQEWGSLIYAEADGLIRWGGVIISAVPAGDTWTIEAAGFASYPHGIAYSGDFSRMGIDPVDAVREIWIHLQSFPNGNLGVDVVGDATPVRLGTLGEPAYTEVYLDGKWQRLDSVPADRVVPSAHTELSGVISQYDTTIALKALSAADTDAEMVTAAKAIGERMNAGLPVNGDWTFPDCPQEVTDLHMSLLTQWQGQREPTGWLQRYADSHAADSRETQAAQAIVDRMTSGKPIAGDWTWSGCPSIVSTYHDNLHNAWDAATNDRKWIAGFISAHSITGNFGAIALPYIVSIGSEDVLVRGVDGLSLTNCVRGVNGTTATRHFADTDVDYQGTKTREVAATDDEPYALSWWEATDCGQEIDDLASTTPFDWVERHFWADDSRESIAHEIQVGYPRLGRRRDDLVFIQGDNVGPDVVTFESSGDDYANEVDGIGSGEGRTTLRRTTALSDGRLRRAYVYSDKAVSDTGRLDALIANELAQRRGDIAITGIDVIDHPNAPIGSWELGDDVLVHADLPRLGEVSVWCRITGWSLTGDSTAHLNLARSDSFRYGG